MKRTNNKYQTPKVEVMSIEHVHVLCSSGGGSKILESETAKHIGMHIAYGIRKAIFGA